MAYANDMRKDGANSAISTPQNTGIAKPIDKSLIGAAARGLSRLITGADTAWFGPDNPLPPVAQQAEGRAYDYPVGLNINYQPKIYESDSGISFGQLRALSEGCDIVRLCIETRKDQMEKLKWSFRPKDDTKQPDDRCKELTAFFAMPDKRRPWKVWLRVLLEDLLVIDAPALYARKTNGKKLYSLEVMDGSLFKILIQPDGRVPLPPQPAYQQILHGVPAVDYTSDQLIYMPRNPRSHKLYGYSPVEQILVTINTLIRRALYQLKYYTSGTIPEGFLQAPPGWSQDQISKFQLYMNQILAGDLDQRNQALVVPHGMLFNEAKQPQLTDEMDQWLARIVCYGFSLPPTPFIKQNNRATADNAKDMALEEGLAPLMGWVKMIVDMIVVQFFGYDDLEFGWNDEKDTDPLIQAQINQIYVAQKAIKTQNEIRAEIGLPPHPDGDELNAAPPPGLDGDPEDLAEEDENEPDQGNGKPPSAAAKGEKPKPLSKVSSGKKKDFRPVKRNTRTMRQATAKLETIFTRFFATSGKAITDKVAIAYDAISKADDDDDQQAQQIANSADLGAFDELPTKVRVVIQTAAIDGADAALDQIGIAASKDMTAQVHKAGVKYADDRAAEMVGKSWVDGVLVDNPNAEWVITDSTREYIRLAVKDAIKKGLSTKALKKDLMSIGFSPERAATIARTEMINANVAGNMISYRESGVVIGKQWLLGIEACDICVDNAEQGVIPIDQKFLSGDDAPPAHPNCRCDIAPITDPEKLGSTP